MIENVSKDKKTGITSVEFKKTNPVFINTIRRTVIDLVPTMAIDEVTFFQNSSALYDEVLAHRLGLVVFRTDLRGYNLTEECTCKGEGCAKCQTTISLKVTGPKTVYASDIKSKDPKIIPIYPKTILAKLIKGQSIEFQATVKLGRGNTHTKHTPAMIWHTFKPKVTVNNNYKEFEQFKEKYPKEIFTKDEKIEWDYIISQLDCPSISASIAIYHIEVDGHFREAFNKVNEFNVEVLKLVEELEKDKDLGESEKKLLKELKESADKKYG